VFSSHSKAANNTFSHDLSAMQTDPNYLLSIKKIGAQFLKKKRWPPTPKKSGQSQTK
jgi:hypothetical protein